VLHPEHLADVVAPALPDAACVNHWRLFDSTHRRIEGKPIRGALGRPHRGLGHLHGVPGTDPVPSMARQHPPASASVWCRRQCGQCPTTAGLPADGQRV